MTQERIRITAKSGKTILFKISSPDIMRACNEMARYSMQYMDEEKKITLTIEKVEL